MTWYPQDFTKVPMTDMRMRAEPSSGYPGRTYRFYKGKKVFEFGYGLSYSNYSYELVSVTRNEISLSSVFDQKVKNSNSVGYKMVTGLGAEFCEKSKFSVTVRVKNQGKMTGKHPILLFVKQEKLGSGRPVKKLVGFQSVKLNAGENAEIKYRLSPCEHLSTANEEGLMVIEEGFQYLLVGDEEYPINIII